MNSKILIIGACGQIGSELTYKLRSLYGNENVVASDISYSNLDIVNSGLFEIVDATDYTSVKTCVEKYHIDTVYLMAAMLSATGEKYPMKAWDLNMESLFHVLNLAKTNFIKKVFWPSSIAVFGPTTPTINTKINIKIKIRKEAMASAQTQPQTQTSKMDLLVQQQQQQTKLYPPPRTRTEKNNCNGHKQRILECPR